MLLLFGPVGRNFNEILIKVQNFWFRQMHLKRSFAKWRPLCQGGRRGDLTQVYVTWPRWVKRKWCIPLYTKSNDEKTSMRWYPHVPSLFFMGTRQAKVRTRHIVVIIWQNILRPPRLNSHIKLGSVDNSTRLNTKLEEDTLKLERPGAA